MIVLIEKILNVFAYTSLMIAAMAASTLYFSTVLLDISADIDLYLAVFLIFFSVYSLNKLIEVNKDFGHSTRAGFIKNNFNFMFWSSVFSYAIGFSIIVRNNFDLALFSLIPIIFVIFYTANVLPKGFRFKRIKDITFGKNIGVAFVWVAFAVILPTFFAPEISFWTLFSVVVFVFMRLFIATVVFDIVDYNEDKRNRVVTIPVYLGNLATKNLIVILNVATGLFLVLAVVVGWLSPVALFANAVTFYTFFYMWLYQKMPLKKRMISDIVVDGEYLVISLSVFLGTLFFAI